MKAGFVSEESVEGAGRDPLPLHIARPEASIFHVVSEADFNQLPTEDVLGILSSRCIIVTDRAVQPMKFDAKGLSTLASLSTIVSIQGIISL